jgi:hypothetical protein
MVLFDGSLSRCNLSIGGHFLHQDSEMQENGTWNVLERSELQNSALCCLCGVMVGPVPQCKRWTAASSWVLDIRPCISYEQIRHTTAKTPRTMRVASYYENC